MTFNSEMINMLIHAVSSNFMSEFYLLINVFLNKLIDPGNGNVYISEKGFESDT